MVSNDTDNHDISLYVPWRNNSVEMEEELATISSIHKNNLQEFRELKKSIKNLFPVETSYPENLGQCTKLKKKFVEEENKDLETFENNNSKYNLLLDKETKFENELNRIEKNSEKSCSQLGDLEEEEKNAKKTYQSSKTALNVAINTYESNLGLEVTTVEEENSEIFSADVTFKGKNKDCLVKFTINRALNEIVDFEAAWLETAKFEELKTKFGEAGDVLSLVCSLRSLALNQ